MEERAQAVIRREIADLEAQEAEQKENRKRLRETRNELAYLTASAYVVHVNDADIVVYGISKEVKRTRAKGFCLSYRDHKQSCICFHLFEGTTLYVVPGEQIRFRLHSVYDDGPSDHLAVTFLRREEAESWAEKRRQPPPPFC